MIAGSTIPPANLTWVGNINDAWEVEATANFSTGSSAVFHNGDNVTFDDSTAVHTVSLAGPVAPSATVVDTALTYTFTGAGGITGGSLTIEGGGVVELANSGNSYSGATTISAGALVVTGDANAMVSPITIADGATLVMDAADAASMASTIEVQAGGVLQVGTLTSDANVLADSPASIVNEGTIRVFDDEGISHVSGSGAIALEHETARLANNLGFQGVVTVMSGAVAEVLDSNALGDASGETIVESGGAVLVTAATQIVDDFTLAGDGSGAGALRVAAGQGAFFYGNIAASGDNVMLGLDAAAVADFTGDVNSSASTPLVLRADATSQFYLQGATVIGAGGLMKSGSGLANLSGPLSLQGPASVADGVLRLSGSGLLTGQFNVAQGASLELMGTHAFATTTRLTGSGEVSGNLLMPGTISPGTTSGILSLLNDLTLGDSSVVEIDLGGTSLGSDYDRLAVGGSAQLDGGLHISLINGFAPVMDDAFTILTASQLTGSFDDVDLPSLDPGLLWQIAYLPDQVLLSVTSAVEYDADFNGDSVVDGEDLALWQAGFGALAGAVHADGDASGDFAVDGVDFLAWQRQFYGGPAGLGTASAVPEPNSWATLLGAVICLAAVARRMAGRE